MTVTTDAFLAALAAAGDVSTDPDVLATYSHDHTEPGIIDYGTPAVLVRPKTTDEVAAAVRAAAAHAVPIVPRGAGSGLAGGANAIDGCMVLCLERMTAIVDVDEPAMTATVQAGLVNADLGAAIEPDGLWYPPDPASYEFSTIGGNIATNAGGLCCLKYGVTRDSLLGLQAVLADGRVVRVGRRTRKGVAGYDLTSLLCGSEGTLAVICEATVRLAPKPPVAATLAAEFPSLQSATSAIAQIVRSARPSLLELMDNTTIRTVEEFQPMELDGDIAVLLFAQSDVGGALAGEQIAAIERICTAAGAGFVATSDEAAEGRMLMAARRLAYTAFEHRGRALLDDVAVPLPQIPALVTGVERIAAEHGLLIGVFGHAGDGNMHPTIVFDEDTADAARAAFDAIVTLALELGGTIAGEHGIGTLKRSLLARELGPDVLELQRAIKRTFDPADLLNPGKAI